MKIFKVSKVLKILCHDGILRREYQASGSLQAFWKSNKLALNSKYVQYIAIMALGLKNHYTQFNCILICSVQRKPKLFY